MSLYNDPKFFLTVKSDLKSNMKSNTRLKKEQTVMPMSELEE